MTGAFLYNFITLAAFAASVSGTSSTAALSRTAERDLKCLTLGLVASNSEKDQTKLTVGIAASWYFLGRLDGEAPGIDIRRETNRALAAMYGDPLTKDVGAACDAQFRGRGAVLMNIGQGDEK
jgi:hypothetical protein